MNFISAFSELDRLYESVESGLSEKEIKYIDFLCDELSRLPKNPSTSAVEALFKDVPEKVFAITVADIEAVADQCEYQEQVVAAVATMNEKGLKTIGDLAKSLKEVKESLTEATDEEDVVEDETAEEAEEEIGEEVVNKPIVLECVKCGALVIKDESEVTIDEESNLANVGEECAYCEESEGFKAIGTFEPYVVATVEDEAPEEEAEAEVIEDDVIEEGIFDFGKKKKQAPNSSAAEKEHKVTYTIYNENGTKQFSHTFTELPGKMDAEEQLKTLLKDSHPSIYNACKNNRDWMYERTSVPASPFDTKRGRNYFVSELYL